MSWINFKDQLPPENTPVLVVMEKPIYQGMYTAVLREDVMYEQPSLAEINEPLSHHVVNYAMEDYRVWHLLPEMPADD
jgi:hypothetical protein